MSKGICSVNGCNDPRWGNRDWCSRHWQRVKAYGTTELPRRLTSEEKFWERVDKSGDCWMWTGAINARERIFFWGDNGKSVDAVRFSYELSGRTLGKGERARRTCREKLCVRPDHLVATVEERFWSKVEKTQSCWNWVGNINTNGYGAFTIGANDKIAIAAHRWSYQSLHGEIPDGLALDHICRNRACVNPDHLRPVTMKQNTEHQAPRGRKSTSGIRGVYPKDGRWRAGVRHNGKLILCGYFDDKEDAAEAVRLKRIELFTHNDLDRVDA